jgi:hypothetical protein
MVKLKDGRIVVGKEGNHMYFFDPNNMQRSAETPRLYIGEVNGKDDVQLNANWYTKDASFFQVPQTLALPYEANYLTVHLLSTYYAQPDSIRYSYQLVGRYNEWSVPLTSPTIIFTNLNAGDYTLNIKALGVNRSESDIAVIKFKVLPPPWYQTCGFIHSLSIVQEQHKKILDSINYARRIQAAILPTQKFVKESIKNSFV